MKSLAILRRATPTDTRTRSRACRARLRDISIGHAKGKEFREVSLDVVGATGIRHCTIRFYGKIATNTPVWVSCSCEDFRYVHEVALTAVGSASIEYSTGAIPRMRNPRGRVSLCKHLYKASELAVAVRGKAW